MPRDTEIRRLERRTKLLLMEKNIPQAKLDVVRSLLNNSELLPEERYNAILTLIQGCPDKPRKPKSEIRIPASAAARSNIRPMMQLDPQSDSTPRSDSNTLFSLYKKYKSLKFFKKRYLIHSPNRFGITIRKRLIPAPRLLHALKEVAGYQEKVVLHLPDVMIEILKDPDIEEPLIFNYLRVLHRWLINFPLISLGRESFKWMDQNSFDAELRPYVFSFFSFQAIPVELREHIITAIESKLRTLPGFRKHEIITGDPENIKREKEKQNSQKEHEVNDYLMILRSFMPPGVRAEDRISSFLATRYGVSSYAHLLMILMEILVIWKEIDIKAIDEYLEVAPPRVSTIEWEYSIDDLKKFGKDPESRRRRHLERIKQQLLPYEELYRFLNLQPEGQNLLLRGFEIQWKNVDRRQKDFENIFEDDFYTFLDVCLNYFKNTFSPFLDGGLIYFVDDRKSALEGRLFMPGLFTDDLNYLTQLIGEMHEFRSKNPSFTLSRNELKLIFQGKMRSLAHIEKFIRGAGDCMYKLASTHHRLLVTHQRWIETAIDRPAPERQDGPLVEKPALSFDADGAPLPFYNCKIRGFERETLLSKLLHDKPVVQEVNGGLIGLITAFCYQLALECMNEELYSDLSERKNLLRELKELSGKTP
jgi:hypothetical protein